MSYCVNITSLENLPLEQTLLIRYNILCTGTWYLAELLTAYRNVCDTGWTIMYPNHQHPQHTDLPITLNTPNYSATFAWNYGGIPGIDPEDFDETHSYLVQIGLFNYYCLNTGEPSGGATGQNPVTGQQSGVYTGGGTATGGPGIPIPIPPWRPARPAQPQQTEPPVIPNIIVPTGPVGTVGNGEPTGQYTGLVISGGDIFPPAPASQVGQQTSTGTVGIADLSAYYSSSPISIVRPSTTAPGELQNANMVFLPIGTSTPNNINSSSTASYNPIANTVGMSSSYVYSPAIPVISAQNLSYNEYLSVETLQQQITIGQPIVISVAFNSPVSITASIQLVVTDGSNTVEIDGTGSVNCGPGQPLVCGTSTPSSPFNIGPIIIVAKIVSSSQIIATKTIIINSLSSFGEGINGPSDAELPPRIQNSTLIINSNPTHIELLSNKSKYLIYNADITQQYVSLLLGTDYTNLDGYSISVYPVVNWTNTASGNYLLIGPSAYSNSRFKLDGQEVYEGQHLVGINSGVVSGSTMLVEVAPTTSNTPGATNGRLYVSNNYRLRPGSATSTTGSVYYTGPYAKEKLGLIVNGPESGMLSPGFSIREAVSSLSGTASFSSISLLPGYYYSIYKTVNNSINPFMEPIYVGKHS